MAKLEWAPDGGLGRAVIGKVRLSPQRLSYLMCFLRFHLLQNIVPMHDLVRRETRMPVRFLFVLTRISV